MQCECSCCDDMTTDNYNIIIMKSFHACHLILDDVPEGSIIAAQSLFDSNNDHLSIAISINRIKKCCISKWNMRQLQTYDNVIHYWIILFFFLRANSKCKQCLTQYSISLFSIVFKPCVYVNEKAKNNLSIPLPISYQRSLFISTTCDWLYVVGSKNEERNEIISRELHA